jgi:ribosomal protein S12 methylthiotransferase
VNGGVGNRKKIFFVPLGCARNHVDGEYMLGQARAAGHEIVGAAADADTIVVNTCAFIEEARQESIDTILGLAAGDSAAGDTAATTGRSSPRMLVTGCMAERYGEELSQAIPEIDVMVGTGDLDRFVEALNAPAGSSFTGKRHYLPAAGAAREVDLSQGWAWVKVSEGCDHECSFCSIPSFKGRHESRMVEDVVEEVRGLVAAGALEVNLVAQDLSAYGRDRKQRDGLSQLLRQLDGLQGLERVRCFYMYPTTLVDETLDAMRDLPSVCNYLDLPLQHADREMLKRMRRAADPDATRRLLDRVRSKVPDVVLRSSFLVGFPGETDEAFERLCRFVEEQRFGHLSVFEYSREEGTTALALGDEVAPELARLRRDRLLDLHEGLRVGYLAARVGKPERVLVCGRDGDGNFYGRTSWQGPDVDGVTWLGDAPGAPTAGMLDVSVTGSDGYDLFAVPRASQGGWRPSRPSRTGAVDAAGRHN